jgi:hypothetical protein
MLPEVACAVDWPGTANFFKDVIVSGAAAFTAYVAYIGISKWRSEEAGKADFELSRRIGKCVFRMRDVLAGARNPFTFAHEFPDGYDSSDQSQQGAAWAHVFNKRWEPVRDCAIEIQSLRNEAEALWGAEILGALDRLLHQANTLQVAMGAYARDKQARGQHFANNLDFGRRIEAQVFDAGNLLNDDGTEGGSNPLTVAIDAAVNDAATYLRTKLPTHKR